MRPRLVLQTYTRAKNAFFRPWYTIYRWKIFEKHLILQVLNIISRGITKLTLDIDNAMEKSRKYNDDNLVFSPASITVTLAMVLLASSGKTFEEVAKILGLESGIDISNHSEIVHQIFGLLIQGSENSQLMNKEGPRTNFAFGIFVEVNSWRQFIFW